MLELLYDLVISYLKSCSFTKTFILLRSAVTSVLRFVGSVFSCIHSVPFLNFSTRILSHHNFRVKWKRKRGKYRRRWQPFPRLRRWILSWLPDAVLILGGSAVMAVLIVRMLGL